MWFFIQFNRKYPHNYKTKMAIKRLFTCEKILWFINKIGAYNTPLILLDNLPEILKLDKFNYEKEHKFFKSVVYEYNLVNDSILNGLLGLYGFYLISYMMYYVVKIYYCLFDFKDKYINDKIYYTKTELVNLRTQQTIYSYDSGKKVVKN